MKAIGERGAGRPPATSDEWRQGKPVAYSIAVIFAGRKSADALEEPLVDEAKYLIGELELINEYTGHQESKIREEMKEKSSLVATAPGIGPVTAAIIESEIGNTGRFEDVNDVVAFAGLDLAIGNSGKYTSTGMSISEREQDTENCAISERSPLNQMPSCLCRHLQQARCKGKA